jgi:hypothetical protein
VNVWEQLRIDTWSSTNHADVSLGCHHSAAVEEAGAGGGLAVARILGWNQADESETYIEVFQAM